MVHFSTDSLPPAERLDFWYEMLARKMARLEVKTPDVTAFHADIRSQSLASVTLSKNQFGLCNLIRTPATLRDGDDAVTLVACVDGRLDARFGDDEVSIVPGQAVLMPHHRLSDTRISGGTKTYAIRIEREAIRHRMPLLNRCFLRATSKGDPAFAILRAYARQVLLLPDRLGGATAQLVETQLQDLVANVLAGCGSPEFAESRGSGGRAERLHVIKADIEENLCKGDLTISAVAARHCLPVRYVQRLFEEEGITFTEFVLGERLARIHWVLTNSRDANLKVSSAALACGFNNLSHFNQAFRHRYGATPSDMRARARRYH